MPRPYLRQGSYPPHLSISSNRSRSKLLVIMRGFLLPTTKVLARHAEVGFSGCVKGFVVVVAEKLIEVLGLATSYSPAAEGVEVEVTSGEVGAFGVYETSHVKSTEAASDTYAGISCRMFVNRAVVDDLAFATILKVFSDGGGYKEGSIKYPRFRLMIPYRIKSFGGDCNGEDIDAAPSYTRFVGYVNPIEFRVVSRKRVLTNLLNRILCISLRCHPYGRRHTPPPLANSTSTIHVTIVLTIRAVAPIAVDLHRGHRKPRLVIHVENPNHGETLLPVRGAARILGVCRRVAEVPNRVGRMTGEDAPTVGRRFDRAPHRVKMPSYCRLQRVPSQNVTCEIWTTRRPSEQDVPVLNNK